ncbi:malignant fibrous histiocytoma-amplified sequence 1-like [Ptychodera flava]|uniref:malignant fibrous histiocytoma-amplified sequence 1-like n=1 Tax=Ptychodera flava TaxID=63121 RepID=UPI00396A281A
MLTSIENLDIGNNQFKTVPREIFMLKSLKVLRLSVNEIEELPTGFAELKYLENLRIGCNRLRNLPADFGECQSLKYLKLASNRLLEFPTVILKLKGLEQLLISANKIRVLPLELFENEKLQIFHAEGNPLQQPPIEVVNKGLANIREYCQAFKKGDIRDDRLRVLFLGASGAGKTTLCNALIQGHTHEDPERTIGIEQHPYELRDVKMTLWDFAGQLLYYNTHHVFITSGALVILIINLEEYGSHHDNSGSDEATNSSYDDLVGFWIDNIATRVPNAVILVVGTHIDNVEGSKNLMEDIMKRIKNQLDGESKKLQRRIENLCGAIDDDVNGRRKHIENLKSKAEHKLQVQYETPILVCSKEPKTEGLPKFKDAIVNWLGMKGFSLTEHRRDLAPGKTQKASSKKHAQIQRRACMRNVADLVKLVIQKVPGMEKPEQVYPVLKYLHSLGEVIWFDEIEDLRDHVFINPPVLSDIFKMVISDKVDKVVKPEIGELHAITI